jgi:hypothetical protein
MLNAQSSSTARPIFRSRPVLKLLRSCATFRTDSQVCPTHIRNDTYVSIAYFSSSHDEVPQRDGREWGPWGRAVGNRNPSFGDAQFELLQ